MENIVIMGAGANLASCLKHYAKYLSNANYNVVTIWDNDYKKSGIEIRINENTYRVEKPRKIEPSPTVLISSEKYFEDIKNQLISNKELMLSEDKIHRFSYLETYNKERLIDKYKDSKDQEIRHIVRYLQEGGDLEVFMNVPLRKKMMGEKRFDVIWDETAELYYSFWNNKRIYLKRSINTKEKAEGYLKEILGEQIDGSPHCYKRNGFELTSKDVLLDAGAAEGFFALENAEIVKKIIIVENDPEWVEALEYTFRDYQDKVVIVEKILSDNTSSKSIKLDDIDSKDNPITYIKMDIEGYEKQVLKSAAVLKNCSNMKIVVCTYHFKEDARIIESILKENGFKTFFSNGYMYFNLYEDDKIFDLRRGICFGMK